MMVVGIKNEMQEHLWKEFSFSHRIDVEPTPSSPLSWDEMHQRIRKINFDLNKKYLKSSYFPKWKMEDRFWFVGCREGGDGTGSHIHYHLLLHTPHDHRIDVWNDLYWGWMKGSPIVYSRKGVERQVLGGALENGGKPKTIKVHQVRKPTMVRVQHKSKDPDTGKIKNHHVTPDDYDSKFLINVEPVRSAKGSTIYAMKKMHPKMETDEQFICIQ
jgi:hypothetical protein